MASVAGARIAIETAPSEKDVPVEKDRATRKRLGASGRPPVNAFFVLVRMAASRRLFHRGRVEPSARRMLASGPVSTSTVLPLGERRSTACPALSAGPTE